jgi:hypothetical protein
MILQRIQIYSWVPTGRETKSDCVGAGQQQIIALIRLHTDYDEVFLRSEYHNLDNITVELPWVNPELLLYDLVPFTDHDQSDTFILTLKFIYTNFLSQPTK